jgi:predicted aspartyl protease
MADWIGSFDVQGTPVINISVSIFPSEPVELTAIIDTGFTGFLCIPSDPLNSFKIKF